MKGGQYSAGCEYGASEQITSGHPSSAVYDLWDLRLSGWVLIPSLANELVLKNLLEERQVHGRCYLLVPFYGNIHICIAF